MSHDVCLRSDSSFRVGSTVDLRGPPGPVIYCTYLEKNIKINLRRKDNMSSSCKDLKEALDNL
jgi:hypothetical protein